MPALSDYLLKTSPAIIQPNLFVRMLNNATGVSYISDAVTDSNGKWTNINNPPPPGIYSIFTGAVGTIVGTPTATGDTNYIVPGAQQAVNVATDYGADLTGTAPVGANTTKLQAAVTAAGVQKVPTYFPSGLHRINADLLLSLADAEFYGDGMENTIIQLIGAINGFRSTAQYARCKFRDMEIIGDTTTLDAINLPTVGGNAYQCEFRNMIFYTGGRGIFAPKSFSNKYENLHLNSYNNHGLEVNGGINETFLNVYAHVIPTGKYGFRCYGGGIFIGCNGVDNADNWGLFGQSTVQGDA